MPSSFPESFPRILFLPFRLYIEAEVREAAGDPRPIREYAWVPVIRLHLDILRRERRRVSPCRWHVLNGMRCSETTVVRRRGSEKKNADAIAMTLVLMTMWIFLNRGSLTSLVLKKRKERKMLVSTCLVIEKSLLSSGAILTESTVCKQNYANHIGEMNDQIYSDYYFLQ